MELSGVKKLEPGCPEQAPALIPHGGVAVQMVHIFAAAS